MEMEAMEKLQEGMKTYLDNVTQREFYSDYWEVGSDDKEIIHTSSTFSIKITATGDLIINYQNGISIKGEDGIFPRESNIKRYEVIRDLLLAKRYDWILFDITEQNNLRMRENQAKYDRLAEIKKKWG